MLRLRYRLTGAGSLLLFQAAFKMHVLRNLVPMDVEARAMGAEHGIRSVLHVALRVVAHLHNNIFFVVTRAVSLHAAGKFAASGPEYAATSLA